MYTTFAAVLEVCSYSPTKFINEYQENINNISVLGQDSNPTTWKMAQMNLAIHGIETDTFFDYQHPTLKADYILTIRLSI